MAKVTVCGTAVDEEQATATSEYKGKTYYFCAPGCKAAFQKNPEVYLTRHGKQGRHAMDH